MRVEAYKPLKPALPDGSSASGRLRDANHGKHRALVWNRGKGFSWELQWRLAVARGGNSSGRLSTIFGV